MKAELILDYIKQSGQQGVSYSQIERFACKMNNRKHTKAYYSVAIQSLLYSFCHKNIDGKWYLAEEPTRPYYRRQSPQTVTAIINNELRKQEVRWRREIRDIYLTQKRIPKAIPRRNTKAELFNLWFKNTKIVQFSHAVNAYMSISKSNSQFISITVYRLLKRYGEKVGNPGDNTPWVWGRKA